ncbi:MAG: OmpH family outer membrane protein, partial [Alistipes sp.]|nr:OmpH family outer membrane protein [Alistipes sp.]
MKKTLFTLATALCMMACGTESAETTAENADATAAAQQGAGEIAYVQVEAVLAQCDLYKNEGTALQEKTEKAQKS